MQNRHDAVQGFLFCGYFHNLNARKPSNNEYHVYALCANKSDCNLLSSRITLT